MTDKKTPGTSSKVEDEKAGAEIDPDLMSLEELDKVIAEEDPDALQGLESVRDIGEADSSPTLEPLLPEEYLNHLKAPRLGRWIQRTKTKGILLWIWAKTQSVESGKRLITWSLKTFQDLQQQIRSYIKTFKEWPLNRRLAFSMGVVLLTGTFIFTYLAFVKKSFHTKHELFMTSLLSWSEDVIEIADGTNNETFYNSTRIPKNIFNLRKIVVNIRPSENSGPNPMAAFEFSLEGNSTEVLIEIKDREGEILDRVQRAVEEYSFDELNSANGKRMITEKVRATINGLLTLGKIRHVFIQGVIFKP